MSTDDDVIYELLLQIDSNQFAITDRDAYIEFEDERYGFVAPIVNGAAYLSVEAGTLPSGGIPVDVLVEAFRAGRVFFYATRYDPVGRQLYDAPLLVWYRTLNDYDDTVLRDYDDDWYATYYYDYWYPYFYDRYPFRYGYGTISGGSYYPVHRRNYKTFRHVRGRRDRPPTHGSYGRYSVGNFQHRPRGRNIVAQQAGRFGGGFGGSPRGRPVTSIGGSGRVGRSFGGIGRGFGSSGGGRGGGRSVGGGGGRSAGGGKKK